MNPYNTPSAKIVLRITAYERRPLMEKYKLSEPAKTIAVNVTHKLDHTYDHGTPPKTRTSESRGKLIPIRIMICRRLLKSFPITI